MAPAHCRVTSCPHGPFPCPPLPLWPACLPAGPHGSLVLASGLLHPPCAVSCRTWVPLTPPLSPGSATAPTTGPTSSQASCHPRVPPHQLLATRQTFSPWSLLRLSPLPGQPCLQQKARSSPRSPWKTYQFLSPVPPSKPRMGSSPYRASVKQVWTEGAGAQLLPPVGQIAT